MTPLQAPASAAPAPVTTGPLSGAAVTRALPPGSPAGGCQCDSEATAGLRLPARACHRDWQWALAASESGSAATSRFQVIELRFIKFRTRTSRYNRDIPGPGPGPASQPAAVCPVCRAEPASVASSRKPVCSAIGRYRSCRTRYELSSTSAAINGSAANIATATCRRFTIGLPRTFRLVFASTGCPAALKIIRRKNSDARRAVIGEFLDTT